MKKMKKFYTNKFKICLTYKKKLIPWKELFQIPEALNLFIRVPLQNKDHISM
jgi:hypothetical protein